MIKTILKCLAYLLIALLFIAIAFVLLHPTFGGKPDAQSLQSIQQSPYYDGKVFKNLEPTNLGLKALSNEEAEQADSVMDMFFPPEGKHPSKPLPTIKLNKTQLKNGDFVWFGHSTTLFVTSNKTIMVDPVYHNASPIPYTVRPFDMTHKPTIEELPNIDAVLISHDHYDHLDFAAIKKMDAKVTHFYVPLGVKAHLQRWGVSDAKIIEMDWHEKRMLPSESGDIDIILTPSRHFSGRGLSDSNKTLWGSWVVKSPKLSLFFSGDSGYGKHYAEISKRYGGFDIALMEDGQYNVRWDEIHMLPEQSVQAALDLQAKHVLPVHWGKFDLAPHPWKEPIERFLKEAKKHDVITLTPKIGQVFNLDNPPTPASQAMWWKTLK